MSGSLSPAGDAQIVQIDRRLPAAAQAIDLELRSNYVAPAEVRSSEHGGIQLRLRTVEPHRSIGDIAGVIPGNAGLNMMPGVRRPRSRIAAGPALAYPMRLRTLGCPLVDRVGPIA